MKPLCCSGGRLKGPVSLATGSGLILLLMPKCPACVAAYIALATGLSLSFSGAAFLRTSVLVLCGILLAFAVTGLLVRSFNLHPKETKS